MSMRITTGIYGGRALKTPPDHKIRPTRDMVRQAAFSMLLTYVDTFEGITVFDLFAGSGALGLEALSRGAKYCAFVDMYPQYVTENLENLDVPAEDYGIFRKNALNFLPLNKGNLRSGSLGTEEKADLILADPPYSLDLLPKLLEKNAKLGKAGTIWLCESENGLKFDKELKKKFPDFELLKEREYGSNRLWILQQLA